jgi:hypothetical protein
VVGWVRSLATAQSPGGKAGHDPPSVHRTPGRLVAFSDAFFAIHRDPARPGDQACLLGHPGELRDRPGAGGAGFVLVAAPAPRRARCGVVTGNRFGAGRV